MTRRGWVLPLVVVLLVALPIAEVWLLIAVGQAIGVLPTLGILVAEAALGGWLLRREGRRAWSGLTGALGRGTLPAGELTDAALVLVGGVLLMLPGFVTDVLGLFFLVPLTRPLARRALLAVAAPRLPGPLLTPPGWHRTGPDGVVIEGETVDAPTPGPGERPPGELGR